MKLLTAITFLIMINYSLIAQSTIEVPLDLTPRSIAKRIYAKESDSIETAFKETQFTILMKDGSQIIGKNGISVHEWNLDIMTEGMKKESYIKLKDFLLAWQLAATAKKGIITTQVLDQELLTTFLADLKIAANLPKGEPTGRRSLSHLVVALGRLNPNHPYDLLSENVSMDVPLNVVQLGLLTQKMSADFWVKGKNESPQPFIANKSFFNKDNTPGSSCVMTETEGLLFDVLAVASGPLVSSFYDKLGSAKFVSESGLARFDKITGVSNIVLNYVKFIWSMAAFDAKIVPEKSPLVRTKNRIAGENVNINATFKMDGSSAQIINCIRPALNAVGIDFSLPQGGPLVGSLVEWDIATLLGSKNDVVQTVGVADPRHQETDQNGFNQITVQGKPQVKELDPEKTVAIDRIVPITALVNLKNKNPKQDIADLFSLIGGASGLWTQPVEILNRAPFVFGGKLNLDVRDFKELEGDLFQIEGQYTKLFEEERGVAASLKNIKDHFIINTEVKVQRRSIEVELLTFEDGKSQFLSDYPESYIEGEGCKVQQSAVGEFEAFLANKKSLSLSGSTKKNPDGSIYAIIDLSLEGHKKIRGFKYSYDSPCPVEDIAPEFLEKDSSIKLSFDSLQLNQVGKSIIIDKRYEGTGWVFKVTYVK